MPDDVMQCCFTCRKETIFNPREYKSKKITISWYSCNVCGGAATCDDDLKAKFEAEAKEKEVKK